MKSSFFRPYRMGFLKVTCAWSTAGKQSSHHSEKKHAQNLGLLGMSDLILNAGVYPGKRCTTTWVVDDVCHHSLNVAIPLCMV